MSLPSCSLWIFVARTDIPFMMETIPHLARINNFAFEEKVLAIDTAPLTGEKVNRPGVGTMQELRDCARQLLEMGAVDRAIDINYDSSYRDRVYRKHFGTPMRATHNYKGYPILGSIFKIEECKSDYMLHFDSDMMMYQNPDCSWIAEGIELMEAHPQMLFVRPLAGPPSDKPVTEPFERFSSFGSRVYLINCQRFDRLLPLPIIWRSYYQKIFDRLPNNLKTTINHLTGKGKLESWEIMVSRKLEKTDYFRANLTNPKAWTLHPKDRSPKFIEALPQIIARIERGDYPAEQAGDYDLISELWF